MMAVPFVPGIEVSRRLYHEAVRPLLDQHFPGLNHAAAIVGSGSDVLGFDTEMSTDHWWGPIVHLFVDEADLPLSEKIREVMSYNLPFEIAGYPVNFGDSAAEPGMDYMHLKTEYPIKHHVFVTTIRDFMHEYLRYNPDQPSDMIDWLTFPMQRLLTLTAGAVHFDGIGELTAVRKQFAWYPQDVWLYLLVCGWQRIAEQEHLMPRAGYVGDEIGSALLGSRLVHDIMLLCFLMEKQYAPYEKWFGTAFARLKCGIDFMPALRRAQTAHTWQERESAIAEAYTLLARMHNALHITEALPETPKDFFGRPFKVISGGAFADAIAEKITDPVLKQLLEKERLGSIDQFSDSIKLRENISLRPHVRRLYEDV